jgi:hypothetical protein
MATTPAWAANKTPPSALSGAERRELASCEDVIERGLKTFVEVGGALFRIRDRRLYRLTHETFEDYCRDRWKMGKSYANRMIAASEVVGNLTPIGAVPATESQARPLASLPFDQQREAWTRAITSSRNGKPTAAQVQAAVDELSPRDDVIITSTSTRELPPLDDLPPVVDLHAPWPWFGGKSRAAQLIWPLLGNVRNYIEPFFGSGAVLLARPHKPDIETGNDAYSFVVNFWRATAAEPEAVAEFCNWPVNEADLHARHRWLVYSDESRALRERILIDPHCYDAKIAGWWCWGLCSWIGAGWCPVEDVGDAEPIANKRPQLCNGNTTHGPGVHGKVHGKKPRLTGGRTGDLYYGGLGVHSELTQARPQIADAWSNSGGVHGHDEAVTCEDRRQWLIGWFMKLRDRVNRVRFCCGDWRRVCNSQSSTVRLGLTGIFFDPPYSAEAGRNPGLYAHDSLTIAHDVRAYCLERGGDPQMRIVLAGYLGEGHEELEQYGWRRLPWPAAAGYNARTEEGQERSQRERLWCSPHTLMDALDPGWFDDPED